MDNIDNVDLNDILKIAQITEQVERLPASNIKSNLLARIMKKLEANK